MVTITFTEPTACAGVVAVIALPSLFTTTLVAELPSNVTEVVPMKLVPLIVTEVPPAVLPLTGLIPVMVGGDGGV